MPVYVSPILKVPHLDVEGTTGIADRSRDNALFWTPAPILDGMYEQFMESADG